MPDFDYDELSLGELEKIQKDVTKAIATYHSRKRKEAKGPCCTNQGLNPNFDS